MRQSLRRAERRETVSGTAIDPFAPAEIERLVATFGSPLLILDCERVRAQYRRLAAALPRVDLHYALKPLPHRRWCARSRSSARVSTLRPRAKSTS